MGRISGIPPRSEGGGNAQTQDRRDRHGRGGPRGRSRRRGRSLTGIGHGLEPSRGPADLAGPVGGQHRPLRVPEHRPPRRADGHLELDPRRGPGGRADVLRVLADRPLQHPPRPERRRQAGRDLPVRVRAERAGRVPAVDGAAVHRHPHRRRQGEGDRRGHDPAGQHRTADDAELPRARHGRGRDVRRRQPSSPASARTRSSATSARSSTRSGSARAPARPAAARTSSPATASTRSHSRSRSPTSTRRRTSSACGRRRSGRRSPSGRSPGR